MLWRLGVYTVILHTLVLSRRRGPPQCAAAAVCRRTPATEAKLQLFCPCLAVTAARCALYWQRLTLALVGLRTLLKGFLLTSKEDSGFLHAAAASTVMHGAHCSRTENQCIKLREEPK